MLQGINGNANALNHVEFTAKDCALWVFLCIYGCNHLVDGKLFSENHFIKLF